MNSLLCIIGVELASKLDTSPNPLLSNNYRNTNNSVGLRFRTIEVQEIRDALAKAETSKSFGHENISCYVFQTGLTFF